MENNNELAVIVMSEENQTTPEISQQEATIVIKEKRILTKLERIAKEREFLLTKLAASNFNELRPKVAYILNHHPETRNSDIALSFKYWRTFYPELITSNGTINELTMYKLERQSSIIRARAKIQNEYGLFQADEAVKTKRMTLSDTEKEDQLSDKPGIPTVTYHLDESGKTQKYVLVGGVSYTNGIRSFAMSRDILSWRNSRNIRHEFHFTEMTKNKLDSYKEFINIALKYTDNISFKAVAVQQAGLKNKSMEDIVCELHYQVVHKGMEHDIEKGRISVPREASIYKDKEDGSDNLTMTKLEQQLKFGFSRHFDNQLTLGMLSAIDSKANYFIQLADLYVGSVSRIINREEAAQRNHKDELAEYFLNALGLTIQNDKDSYQDIAFIKIL